MFRHCNRDGFHIPLEAYLVSGGRGVHCARGGRDEGHGRLLGKVHSGVQGAGRVDEGREHLEK